MSELGLMIRNSMIDKKTMMSLSNKKIKPISQPVVL